MRVLVLGGSRFVGRAIVNALAGAYDVTVLNRGTHPNGRSDVHHIVADRDDADQMRRIRFDDFDGFVDVSATTSRQVQNLLDALPEGSLERPYVFVSSASVYDRAGSRPPFREGDPATGDDVWGDYGIEKASCEARLAAVLPALSILRAPYIYGPANYEDRERWLWARLLADRPIFVPGDGQTLVQFCHVDSFAETVVAAICGQLPRDTYNVGEPRYYSFASYLELLGEVVGAQPRIRFVADANVPAREYFPFRNVELTLDVAKLGAHSSWRPRSLREGLRSSYPWFRTHADLTYRPNAREREWSNNG